MRMRAKARGLLTFAGELRAARQARASNFVPGNSVQKFACDGQRLAVPRLGFDFFAVPGGGGFAEVGFVGQMAG